MSAIDVCPERQATFAELNSKLLHADRDSAARAPGLSYPDIRLAPDANADYEQQLPILVRGTGGSARWLRADENPAQPSLVSKVGQQVASRLWALAWPLSVTRKWLMGYSLELLPGALQLPSALSSSPVTLPPAGMPPPMAWHPHRSLLATADSSSRIHIHDMSSKESGLGGGALRNGRRAPLLPAIAASAAHNSSGLATGGAGTSSSTTTTTSAALPDSEAATQAPAPAFVLAHTVQPEVHSLAWRPHGGACFAVGTRGLVCLWELSGGGPASLRPPVSARSATALTHARGDRGPGPWLSVLRVADSSARLSALSWSPDGRVLAAGSPDMPGVTLWDVASGESSRVGVGLAAITLLRWSPCGNYLLGAGVGPRFHVWETARWACGSWDAPTDAGAVSAAAWAPAVSADSSAAAVTAAGAESAEAAQQQRRLLLLSFCRGGHGGSHLVALHFVGKPPSLDAMLMPVLLQDIAWQGHPAAPNPGPDDRAGSNSGSSSSTTSVVSDWAWDPTGERLAVLLTHPHPAAGCIALYATSVDPVVHAQLIGFARPPFDLPPPNGQHQCVKGRVATHGAFARGALFSVRFGGSSESMLYNLPLYFK